MRLNLSDFNLKQPDWNYLWSGLPLSYAALLCKEIRTSGNKKYLHNQADYSFKNLIKGVINRSKFSICGK